jgi:hypothetical protein
VRDTILLEGTPEPIELELLASPPGFPLPFSAYVPSDFMVEWTRDPAFSVRFLAAFGGHRNPDAFAELTVHAAGTGREEAETAARAALEGSAATVTGIGSRHTWAIAEWGLRDPPGPEPRVGRVALGLRGGRFFHWLERYPAEYGDGFPPRSTVILETLRWEDGTPLEGP